MAGALDGIVVVDFSTLLPGPMATLLLAEAGAEVIKIERPGTGEDMRSYMPKWGGDSANFALLNRGKKSLTLDLKNAADVERVTALVDRADVLVEQFRPGVMDRLGLGYGALSKRNPRLIYCSITGYGQTGPKRDAAGHDVNYVGDCGLLALSLGTTDAPVMPPALVADIAGGTYPAVINILLALRDRDRTGRGTHIDVAMSENVLPFTFWAMGEGQVSGHWPGSGDRLLTGGTPRYRLYATADSRFVASGAIEQKFWDAFTAAIGLEPQWRDDTRDPRATIERVESIIRSRTSEHWRPILAQADCCCTIVQTLAEAMQDPHLRARKVFSARVSNAEGDTLIAVPMPVAPQFRAAADKPVPAPALGQHDVDFKS